MQVVTENNIETMPLKAKSRMLLDTLEQCIKKYQAMTAPYNHLPENYEWGPINIANPPYHYLTQYALIWRVLSVFGKIGDTTDFESTPITIVYGLSVATVSFLSLSIDVPIAFLASLVGLTSVVPLTIAEQVSIIRERITKAMAYHFSKGSMPPQVIFLSAQHHIMSQLLADKNCDSKRLAEVCDNVVYDIKLLARQYSNKQIKLGVRYLSEDTELTGLRHYITGRSRLADILQADILDKFDFGAYVQSDFPTITIAAYEPAVNTPLLGYDDNSVSSPARFLRQLGYFSPKYESSAESPAVSCLETPKPSK